jgi:hypothetical protein
MQTLSYAFGDLEKGFPYEDQLLLFFYEGTTINRSLNTTTTPLTDVPNKIIDFPDSTFMHGLVSARFVILHEFAHIVQNRAQGISQFYRNEPKVLFSQYQKQVFGNEERWAEAFAASMFGGNWNTLINNDPLVLSQPDLFTLIKTKGLLCLNTTIFAVPIYSAPPTIPFPQSYVFANMQ